MSRCKLRANGGDSRDLSATRVHRAHGSEITLPQYFEKVPEHLIHSQVPIESIESIEEQQEQAAEHGEGGEAPEGGDMERYPPAVAQESAFNLVKFYGLERSLVSTRQSNPRRRTPVAVSLALSLSLSLFIRLSIYLSIYLSLYLSRNNL